MNNLLIVADAVAPAAAPKAGGIMSFLPFIIIIGAMFFITIRSQKKQAAKRTEMMSKIIKGTEVVLANGIFGKITEVLDKSYLVEIAPNVIIKVIDQGITTVINKDETEVTK